MPYLTPDSIPASLLCRSIDIPNDFRIVGAVSGALLELTYERNWESYGSVTPKAMADKMVEVVFAFLQGTCVPEGAVVEVDAFYHIQNQNVAGGGILANTDTPVPFTVTGNFNSGNVTLAGGAFFCQLGLYLVEADTNLFINSSASKRLWLFDAASGFAVGEGIGVLEGAAANTTLRLKFLANITQQNQLFLYARSNVGRATDAFGRPTNVSGHVEHYATIVFSRLGDPL